MKKLLAILLTLSMIVSLAACGADTTVTETEATEAATEAEVEETEAEVEETEAEVEETEAETEAEVEETEAEAEETEAEVEETEAEAEEDTEAEAEEAAEETGDVMSYEDFMAAEIDDEVVIDTYVQAHQSWWEDKITCYTQDKDGGYFLYEMACSEEDAEKLVPGTKIRVTGYKAEWSGEVEIADATFEFLDENDTFIASPKNVTKALGTDELADDMNKLVAFRGMTVAPIEDADGNEAAFLYNWDGSGEQGNDLYFNVSLGEDVYNFVVESYLCDQDSDVYKAVEAFEIGDVIDMTGFLYWYNDPNPHIISVEEADLKGEGVMTYDEFLEAEIDDEVVIETYVQAHQSWWEDQITCYTQDKDGGYFLYNMACSEEDAEKLVPGTKIRVTGYKAEWAGEVEIADATFEILEGEYIADAKDIAPFFGEDALTDYANQFVAIRNAVVEDAGDGAAFLYNWDGSGAQGDDLYFNVSLNGETYTFTVESYLCGQDTEVYQAVEGLEVGDVIDLEGFLYWYEGAQPHVTNVTVK